MELAAESAKIDYDLGLGADGSVVEFFKGAPICLAKLHGCIDWSMDAY